MGLIDDLMIKETYVSLLMEFATFIFLPVQAWI